MDILPYQSNSRIHRRRRVFAGVMIVAALLVALSAYLLWPRLMQYRRHLDYLQAQNRILNHVAGESDVALDENENNAAALLRLPGYKSISAKDNSRSFVSFQNPDFHFLFGQDEAHAFYGRRSTADGKDWLIFIFVADEIYRSEHSVTIYGISATPTAATSLDYAVLRSPDKSDSPQLQLELKPTDRLKVYAGLPYPSDKSKFTIRYELGGKAGRISGKILNEGAIIFQHEVDVTGEHPASQNR